MPRSRFDAGSRPGAGSKSVFFRAPVGQTCQRHLQSTLRYHMIVKAGPHVRLTQVGRYGPIAISVFFSRVSRNARVGMAMFVRMGTFRIKPDALDALRERYYADCAPVVQAAKGNVDCYVLEPVERDAPVVVCTVWQTEADAVAYEATGAAA